MTNQPAETTKTPALSRTWRATVDYCCYGENWGSKTYTLTLSRETVGGELRATVDGQPADPETVIRILRNAESDGHTPEVLAEVLAGPTLPAPLTLKAPIIGKARAHKLHKIMGLLGLSHAQHYGVAAFALDEPFPLESLSTLTETEAERVWAYLVSQYPQARAVAERVSAATSTTRAA